MDVVRTRILYTVILSLWPDWLTQLSAETGSRPTLGIEYHHWITAAETVSFIQRMPTGTLDFIEEFIRDETPDAYESLRRMIDVPFALGEEFASKWQFLPYLERGIAQFARVDVCNVGGLTEAMKVATLAAACPNFSWLEEINTPADSLGTNSPDFYPLQPQLQGARYRVPDQPGLGVEFNEALAAEQDFTMREIPRLKRNDGSFTNW